MSKCRTGFCICATFAFMMFSFITARAPSDNNTPTDTTSEASECIFSASNDSSGAESLLYDESHNCSSTSIDESTESVSNDISTPETLANDAMVLISSYAPEILLDIRYATTNNFTGTVIYDNNEAYLRYGTLKKLMAVQTELHNLGYGLKIWDAYRPTAAQWKLWEVYPDASFVADPHNGYSNHSRGNTVDVTLVTLDGEEVAMPSEFDEFGIKAHRIYDDDPTDVQQHALLLETCMQKHGFVGYKNEWWHFTDTVTYPVKS